MRPNIAERAVERTGGRHRDRQALVLGHFQLIAETPALPEIMVTRDPTSLVQDGERLLDLQLTLFVGEAEIEKGP